MKKSLLLFLSVILTNFLIAQDFTVEKYVVDITLSEKGYFDVVERYDLNFQAPKHGIYRDIITNYDFMDKAGNRSKRKIEISKVEVPDYKFQSTSRFAQRLGSDVQIKIGDADFTVEGPQQYEIRYRVKNAFIHEENNVSFYWNIKPSDWVASFSNIEFTIHLPNGVTLSDGQGFIYAGEAGSTEPSDLFNINASGNQFSASTKSNAEFYAGESVTVLLKLPPGSIQENKPLWPFWSNYGWVIILSLIYFGFYSIWKKYGKDDHAPTVTSYYPPKGMDSAMVGLLIDDSSDTADLISLIPYWASNGFITIEEIENKGWFAKDDTKLIKIKDIDPEAPSYQRQIFNGLFLNRTEILVSSLKEKFHSTMTTAKSSLKDAAQIYYVNQSNRVKNYTIIGTILITLILVPTFLFFWGILASIAMGVSCVVLLILSQYMIKKNKEGTEILSELKGFKQFIKVAEENKLKMLLKDDPSYFETTMSYALAFGMFDKWAKKFDGLNLEPPNWYHSSTGRAMSMNHFSKSFSNSIKSTQTNMVSSPSSSGGSGGGGSSGGGFGGGGGGSW